MKTLKLVLLQSTVLLIFLMAGIAPNQAQALSCIYPDQQYAESRLAQDSEAILVVAKVVDSKDIRNFSGVKLQITGAIKGYSIPNQAWAYYRIDETWGYLCAGEPIPIGDEAVFDLYVEDGVFYVSQAYNLEGESQPAREMFLENIQPAFEFMTVETRLTDLKSYGQELLAKLLLIINELVN